jgi:hypothetical protein
MELIVAIEMPQAASHVQTLVAQDLGSVVYTYRLFPDIRFSQLF